MNNNGWFDYYNFVDEYLNEEIDTGIPLKSSIDDIKLLYRVI
jgi:hypothetical protein